MYTQNVAEQHQTVWQTCNCNWSQRTKTIYSTDEIHFGHEDTILWLSPLRLVINWSGTFDFLNTSITRQALVKPINSRFRSQQNGTIFRGRPSLKGRHGLEAPQHENTIWIKWNIDNHFLSINSYYRCFISTLPCMYCPFITHSQIYTLLQYPELLLLWGTLDSREGGVSSPRHTVCVNVLKGMDLVRESMKSPELSY